MNLDSSGNMKITDTVIIIYENKNMQLDIRTAIMKKIWLAQTNLEIPT